MKNRLAVAVLAVALTSAMAAERSTSSQPSPQRSSAIRTEDVERSKQTFQRSHFDLRSRGELSENLVMLARLGVRFEDPQGRARDFSDVAIDTAAAFQRIVASGKMTSQEAQYAALEAGFVGSFAAAVATNAPTLPVALKRPAAPTASKGSPIRSGNWDYVSTGAYGIVLGDKTSVRATKDGLTVLTVSLDGRYSGPFRASRDGGSSVTAALMTLTELPPAQQTVVNCQTQQVGVAGQRENVEWMADSSYAAHLATSLCKWRK
jgi:hypothetical protein